MTMEERAEKPGPDWKIEKRKPHCSGCSREYSPEEPHYSAIVEAGEGFARRDYCLSCWEPPPEGVFSYWKTQAPPRKEHRLENVQAMVDFFVRLLSSPLEDPSRRKVAYLVALLLMRRRRLRLLSSGGGWLELEKAWDGETVRLPDPAIAESELETLKGELERLFHAEAGAADPVS